MQPDDAGPDYRFSLANERTFLAWIRTALALVAGGVAAAKLFHFENEAWRWVVAVPPILAGAFMSFEAAVRWRTYEDAIEAERRLPVGRGIKLVGLMMAIYALLVLAACAIDS